MRKYEFLKKLEAKLMILDETERKDIIDEYDVIITDKINDGKTEEESIRDFGSIDELVKEILSAYKINPEYKSEGDKGKQEFENFINEADSLIKRVSKKITEIYNNLLISFKETNGNISLEGVFEIIIKSMISLLIMALLFQTLNFVATFIAKVIFDDFRILKILAKTLINASTVLLYLSLSILVVNKIIKKVAANQNKESRKNIKKSVNQPKKVIKETIEVEKNNINIFSNISKIIYTLVKVITIIWTLPLVGITIFSYFMLIILIYLIIKGLLLVGPILLLIGICGFLTSLLGIIYYLIGEKNKKNYFYPVVISMVLVALGTIMTFEYVTSINYLNEVPTNKYTIQKESTTKTLTGRIDINTFSDVIIDNSIADNEVIFEFEYYKEFAKYDLIIYDGNYKDREDEDTSMLHQSIYIHKMSNRPIFTLTNELINSLKEKQLYPLDELNQVKTTIKVNQNTYDRIENFMQ